MNKFRYIALVFLGTGVLMAQAARASTIIDNFDEAGAGLWPLVVNAGTPGAINSEAGLAGVVGGVRDASVSWMAGPLNVSASVLTGPGIYALSSDALTDGSSTLSYDAGGAGLNLDLLDPHGTGPTPLDQSFFVVEVISSDLGGIPIDVTITDGGGTSSTRGGIAAGGGTVSIPLSDFLPLDFSDIDTIAVAFDPPAEFDITVDFLAFDWADPTGVPEPTTLLLMGLGLAGLGFARRRSLNA